VTALFAPGITTIELPPWAVTWITAIPEGPGALPMTCNGLDGEPPTDAQDDSGDDDGSDRVGVFEQRQVVALAGEGGGEAEHDGERRPHVGGEVDGVCGESVRSILACDAAEGARAGEIDGDGAEQHDEWCEGLPEREVVVEEDAVNRLGDQPDAGGKHDAGLDEGGEGLDLAMAVVVVLVGGAVGDLDGEEGDDGGDEVDAGVRRLG
jgi:hypothetical protein